MKSLYLSNDAPLVDDENQLPLPVEEDDDDNDDDDGDDDDDNDEDDDEDYDWEVPTKDTSLKMKKFVEELKSKHKGFKISWTYSEKNWIMIQVSK